MIVRYFDLAGGTLSVSATSIELIRRFATIFDGECASSASTPIRFELELSEGTPAEVPESARLLHRGPVLDEGECIAAEVEGELLQVFPGRASLRLSLARPRAELTVAPQEIRRASMNLAMIALEAAMRRSGQVPIHAAGLTLPDDRMVMIIGRSGAGKTTTALALVAGGFGLCSDDLVVCRTAGAGVTGWGLPRSLKVHRNTAAMLPWVEPLLVGEWSGEEEKSLPLASMRRTATITDRRPRAIAGLCLLERSPLGRTSISRMGHTETLAVAAADHVRTSYAGVLPAHASHLNDLAGIVRRLPAYRLLAGADLANIGTLIRNEFCRVEQES